MQTMSDTNTNTKKQMTQDKSYNRGLNRQLILKLTKHIRERERESNHRFETLSLRIGCETIR